MPSSSVPMPAYVTISPEAASFAHEFVYQKLIPELARNCVIAVTNRLERQARDIIVDLHAPFDRATYTFEANQIWLDANSRFSAASLAMALGSAVVIAVVTTASDGSDISMHEVERASEAGKLVVAYRLPADPAETFDGYLNSVILERGGMVATSMSELLAILVAPGEAFDLEVKRLDRVRAEMGRQDKILMGYPTFPEPVDEKVGQTRPTARRRGNRSAGSP